MAHVFALSLADSSASQTSVIDKWEQTGPPDIEPQELVLGEKLGEGQFGTVYRGTCRGKVRRSGRKVFFPPPFHLP